MHVLTYVKNFRYRPVEIREILVGLGIYQKMLANLVS